MYYKSMYEYLEKKYEEVSPMDFYRDIFPWGELQEQGKYEKGKYNAIAISIHKKKVKRHTVTDDLEKIEELIETDDFCLMSPISYIGKERKSTNARFLYALAIDVDGLKRDEETGQEIGIEFLEYQYTKKRPYLPYPTYIVGSGTGLHIYYVLKKPVPLFPNIVKELEKLKRRLTWQFWTQGALDYEHAHSIQYESLFQGFRIPGTITKKGTRARVWKIGNGESVDIEYLNSFVPEEDRAKELVYKSELTLSQAKEKYPEWYEKRIVQGQPKKTWKNKRDLYDWWLRTIKEKGKEGHRYWCVMALASYAKKCQIPREELEKDALSLIDLFNEDAKDLFTEDDVIHALEAYNDSYITYPIDTISSRTDIPIKKNKRNYQKQKDHLEEARAIRDIRQQRQGKQWYDNSPHTGAPTKEEIIREWQENNPNGSKAQCHRETGLDPKTIRKWWK